MGHFMILNSILSLMRNHASKLLQVIKEYLPSSHACADDSQLYTSFKLDSKECETGCVSDMETCIRDRSLFIPGVGTEEIWVG